LKKLKKGEIKRELRKRFGEGGWHAEKKSHCHFKVGKPMEKNSTGKDHIRNTQEKEMEKRPGKTTNAAI